jgi:hypothetical protein
MLLLLFGQAPVSGDADITIATLLPTLQVDLQLESGTPPDITIDTILPALQAELRLEGQEFVFGGGGFASPPVVPILVGMNTVLPALRQRLVLEVGDDLEVWLLMEGVVVDTQRLSV